MKKSLIATAVAAGMLATGAAQAAPTLYGILHLSIDTYSDAHTDGTNVIKADDPTLVSHTSAIGVKGSEDLGGGLKALYKAEFRVDPFSGDPSGGSLQRRDVWAGLKGGWGKVAAGTMSSNYKQMGGKVDPLYRTEAEGRGIINIQSSQLHGGAGGQAVQGVIAAVAGRTAGLGDVASVGVELAVDVVGELEMSVEARQVGRQDLDSHLSIELRVFGEIDLAHPTCPQRRKYFVGAESIAF